MTFLDRIHTSLPGEIKQLRSPICCPSQGMMGKSASSLKWAQGTCSLKEREEERRETPEQASLHKIQMGRATGRQLTGSGPMLFEEPGMLWRTLWMNQAKSTGLSVPPQLARLTR